MADVTSPTNQNDTRATAEQLAELGLLSATAQEVAEINEFLDRPIGDGETPAEPGETPEVTPQVEPAPAQSPTAPAIQTVEVDGVQIPVTEAVLAYKNMRAWRRENAEDARKLTLREQEMDRKFEALATALKRVNDTVDARIPAPPPEPLKIDMSDIGPMPDLTTIEGQEMFPEWDAKRTAKVIEAVEKRREERGSNGKTVTPTPAPATAPTPALTAPPGVDPVVWEHNQNLRLGFFEAENLAALNVTPETGQVVLQWLEKTGSVVPTGPIGPDGGRLYQMSDLHRATRAYEDSMSTRTPTPTPATPTPVDVKGNLQATRNASSVMRPGEGGTQAPAKTAPTLRRYLENPDEMIKTLTPEQKYELLRQGALGGLPGFVGPEFER